MDQAIYDKLLTEFKHIDQFVLPSGLECIIREQNGNDDAVLTRVNQAEFKSINEFMRGIIIYLDGKINLSYEDIMKMRLRDKYYALIKSRIFSLGPILKFNYEWPQGVIPYEQDLNEYVPDYSRKIPEEDEPGYYKYRVNRYKDFGSIPLPETFEVKIGEKELRLLFDNGYTEKYILSLSNNDQNINSELLAKNIEFRFADKWMKLSSFVEFSPREMRDLRAKIKEEDERFNGFMELENPYGGNSQLVNLLALPDFFFPLEI